MFAPRPGLRRRLIAGASLLAVFGLLAAVPLGTLFGLGAEVAENRALAPPPSWPEGLAGVLALPRQVDAYLRDHFALRAGLVRANSRLRYALFQEAPTRQVIFGRHGRLFLTSHDASRPFSLIGDICGARVPDAAILAAADGISRLLRSASADAMRVVFAAIPSAPALYPEDLPPWLARQCAGQTSVDRILGMLRNDPAARVLYPFAELAAAKRDGLVIPRYNFHWSGRGARVAAGMIAQQGLGQPPGLAIPAVTQRAASDLSPMVPGLDLNDEVLVPDTEAAGITYCYADPGCLPDLGDIAPVIGDYGRTLSPAAGPRRLLLLSDSFGSFIAPWFGAYFGEVRHVSTNYLDRLSAADRVRLRDVLFTRYRPDAVVFLYHDGAVLYAARRTADLLWPAGPVVAGR